MLFSVGNTVQSRGNKWKYVRVSAYFAHFSINYHLANIARIGSGMVAGRGLACFLNAVKGFVGVLNLTMNGWLMSRSTGTYLSDYSVSFRVCFCCQLYNPVQEKLSVNCGELVYWMFNWDLFCYANHLFVNIFAFIVRAVLFNLMLCERRGLGPPHVSH